MIQRRASRLEVGMLIAIPQVPGGCCVMQVIPSSYDRILLRASPMLTEREEDMVRILLYSDDIIEMWQLP